MGETTDELRRQVDQKRDDASEKIDQIQQQVSSTAQQVTTKATDTVDQIKAQLDWRQQVQDRPLVAIGVALVGGMLLGGMSGGHGNNSATQANGARSGGVAESLRSAMSDSGLDTNIRQFAQEAFGMLGERLKTMTDEAFPGMIDKIQDMAGGESQQATAPTMTGSDRMTSERPAAAFTS